MSEQRYWGRLGTDKQLFLVLPGIAALVSTGVCITSVHQDPRAAFDRQLTGDNACLNSTPFDPHHGAVVGRRHDSATSMIAVQAATHVRDSKHPEILDFTVNNRGIMRAPILLPYGQVTVEYLQTLEHSDRCWPE